MTPQEKVRIYRSLFYGRQDVYGRKVEFVNKEDGTTRAIYAPVCGNFWSQGCHIKNKTGITCEGCEIRKNEPVSDESIAKHLRGEEQHIQYVLQKDGTIKFGAIDLDLKPGKEDKGYTWDDVKKLSNQLKEWGIAHSIARSTTMGFHVYMFFEEFYSADKFRSIMLEAFNRIGFMAYLQMQQKPLAEIFPKQGFVPEGGLGNGIKTPMIVSSYPKERNGWVTEDNEWIGAGKELAEVIEDQWEFAKNISLVPSSLLDELIEREAIQVFYDNPIANKGSKGASAYLEHYTSGRSGKWQPPLSGSIEKVLEGCAAFRRIRDKCLKGEVPGHDEGFTLYHLAMHTLDGLEWFEKHVPGWGKTPAEKKQLEYSIKKDYAPSTCKTMQNSGLCVAGTQCFKKKPPVETVEGKTVVRDDIPESKWAEPSPIRYAFGKGEDFLKKLQEEALEAAKIKEKDGRLKVLYDLAMRSQVFDADQIKEFKQFLKDSKILKVSEISKLFSEASDKVEEGMKKKANDRNDTVQVDENLYQKLSPYGYSLLKPVKGNKFKEIRLCSMDVVIEEVKTYLDEERQVEAVFKGKLVGERFERKFEIPVEKWAEDSELLKLFTVVATNHCTVMRANVPFIRQAAMAYSNYSGVETTNCITSQGWHGPNYIMPSCIVGKEGIRPNTEQEVDLSRKEFAKSLDFEILSDDEFKEVLMHIKTDFLNAWPRLWTTVALSHALTPAILKPLGSSFTKKPTLFFEGLTGTGKTELSHTTQYFWGVFPHILNLLSSGKGIMDVGHDFRDALLVVDDFKGLTNAQTQAVESVIQYSYDGNSSIKMNKNMTQNKAKGPRALFTMTGEQFLSSDAAMVARCIIIQSKRQNTLLTQEFYQRCLTYRPKYSGVTARFIHWFMNNGIFTAKEIFEEVKSEVFKRVQYRQNANRVTYNLALNHTVWNMFVKFMRHNDVLTHDEEKEMIAEHVEYVDQLCFEMIKLCEEEESCWVILHLLKQMLDGGEVSIRGWSRSPEMTRSKTVGFLRKDGFVCLYPDVLVEAVKSFSRNMHIRGTVRSIGRQLRDEGILLETEPGRTQKIVKHDGYNNRVWVVDKKSIWYEVDNSSPLMNVSLTFEASEGAQRLDGIL